MSARSPMLPRQRTDEAIRIVAYDSRWPQRFAEEHTLLEETIGPWVAGGIHHVGSTAVPGLEAKPIIDILVDGHLVGGEKLFGDPPLHHHRRPQASSP